MNSIQGFHYDNEKNLNNALSKVSKKTEYLFFIWIFIGDKVVDFNHLKSSMEVFFLNIGYDEHQKENIKEYSQKMFKHFFNHFFQTFSKVCKENDQR